MDERYITIAVEEYKALIEFKLRKQIEAEYKEELEDAKLEAQSKDEEVRYWYSRCERAEEELRKLKLAS